MIFTLSKTDDRDSIHHTDIQRQFRENKVSFKYTKHHCFSEHALLMTVSEVKYKIILLTVNCNFVISESEKIKNKRVSIQLSNIT